MVSRLMLGGSLGELGSNMDNKLADSKSQIMTYVLQQLKDTIATRPTSFLLKHFALMSLSSRTVWLPGWFWVVSLGELGSKMDYKIAYSKSQSYDICLQLLTIQLKDTTATCPTPFLQKRVLSLLRTPPFFEE